MVFAVQKRRRNIVLSFFFLYLVSRLFEVSSDNLISADSVPDEETSQVQPTITLERRLERSTKIIQFKRTYDTEPLQPVLLRVDHQIRSSDDPTGPMLSLIDGLIQQITLDKDSYEQGEIASLNVSAVLALEDPKITFLQRTYNLYPVALQRNTYNTILAVPMKTEPGNYLMNLSYKDKGDIKKFDMPFTVIAANFSEEDTADLDIHILTEETLEMLKYEGNYFARAYSVNPDSVLYEGDFIWPCSGTITGLFGTPRRYNEDLDKWSHKAVDIANVVGTDVHAPNHGVVVMAKNLEVHGKSIVIAHGKKIHTLYIHLDSLCVEKGDRVFKGQVIGKLGRTGLCTGPNLHWGVLVNRVHTDPRFWIQGKPEIKKGQWLQYKKP